MSAGATPELGSLEPGSGALGTDREARGARAWFRRPLFALALTLAIALPLHLAFADVDLNLSDEGFLWYGVERTVEGRVPVRDFQAYNPLRYWWCAAFVELLGPGILSVRLATAAFGALGLFCGVRVLQRSLRSPLTIVLAGALLALWMFPRHKTFEATIATAVVLGMTRLLEHPSPRRHLEAGALVGLAGVLGPNHLLYAGCAFLACWLWGLWARRGSAFAGRAWTKLGAASLGGILGLAPLWIPMLVVPGFARPFVDSVLLFVEEPVNQALPWPWPWRLGYEHLASPERWSIALAFLLPPLAYAAGLLALVWAPRARGVATAPSASNPGRTVLVAATLTGVFYNHHAAVRSDAWHLAQCISPALLAATALPGAFLAGAGRVRAALELALCALLLVASLLAVPATNPALAPLRVAGPRPALAAVAVAGDTLRLPRASAAYLERVKGALGRELSEGELLFVAPGNTTFYPLLGRRSPFHDVYFLRGSPPERERDMARRLEAGEVPCALIVDTAVDGRADLLLRSTNPLVWQALSRAFVRVPTPELPPDHLLLRWRGR